MVSITQVTARQILDSRGRPTVEASVQLSDGTLATSSVPSGAINNEKHEAVELRDNKPNEYFGYGVTQAVNNINTTISQALIGKDPLYQTQIDQALVDLDGTKNKSKLGANAILATSQAVMKAAAASLRLPLFVYVKEKYKLVDAYRIPTPIFNLINGGRHGSGTLDFQEFQLVPASHLPYPQALRIGVEFFLAIEKALEQKGAITTVGLEGGFSPNLAANADALEIFNEAAKMTSYTISQDAFLGIDIGPSFFYKGSKYSIKDRPQPMTSKEFTKYLKDLHEQYRVFAFEDPLVVDAWSDWKTLTAELGQTAMIVADDLVATNKTLLIKAIQEKACNAIAIKPNRIGTVTEAIEIVSIAKQAGWHTIMSHRSSETIDDFLADLAVGIGTDYVKFGAPSRGERVAKYNRLLRIEEILRASQPETASAPSPAPVSSPSTPATPPTGAEFAPQTSAPSAASPSQPAQQPTSLPSWMSGAKMDATPPANDASMPSMMNQPSAMPATTPTAPAGSATMLPAAPALPTQPTSSEALQTTQAPPVSAMPLGASLPSSAPVSTMPGGSPLPSAAPVTAPAPSLETPPSAAAIPPTEPALPELSISPSLSNTPSAPTSSGADLPPGISVAAPAMPSASQTTPMPATNEPLNIGASAVPGTPAPEADNIQDSLNELAQMVSTSSTPAAAPTPVVPAPVAPTPAPAPLSMATPELDAPPGITTAAPTLPEENAPDVGGLPRPVPPKFS